MRKRNWTAEEIETLGVATDIATAGSIFGFGRSKSYALARDGQFPVRVLRIAGAYVVPVEPILRLLTGPGDEPGPQADGPVRLQGGP
ncbi:DNA-binding protein [Longispora sp. K20-0274]|uniref:DNA-binding protein n=1 Tax=Longispora sp. K20-0274 TaxID=3088255 RepID=UPI00399B2DAC